MSVVQATTVRWQRPGAPGVAALPLTHWNLLAGGVGLAAPVYKTFRPAYSCCSFRSAPNIRVRLPDSNDQQVSRVHPTAA
jgi:hypothetical protein